MSTSRDSLDPARRARYDDAIAKAAPVLKLMQTDQAALAAAQGPRAVAEAAWYPGHPLGTVDAIEACYRQLQDEARCNRDGDVQ